VPAAKPAYGDLDVASATERVGGNRTVVALLLLVTGLAAATIWFVALPLFATPDGAPQDCGSFVLTDDGVLRCVPESTPGTAASRPQS
jgi:hypothetical protein